MKHETNQKEQHNSIYKHKRFLSPKRLKV